MLKLVIGDIVIRNYNKFRDRYILDEINGESKSDMIHQEVERLQKSRVTENLEFSNAYLVDFKGETVGYLYLSGKSRELCYIEYLIFKKYRGQGIGNYLLTYFTDYLMFNNTDLKEVRLNIDVSNLASIKTAVKCGFLNDEDDYKNQKLDFIMFNDYYQRRKRK